MSPVVTRPQMDFEAGSHSYTMDGEKLSGISTVAKVGGFEESFGIASAWGFRIGYEGAYDVFEGVGPAEEQRFVRDKPHLRELLQKRGLTPWSKRDKAAERGNWVHDVLEGLGQSGEIPDLSKFSEEVQAHAKAVLRWYLDFRPEFVSTEVQVASKEHRFAGRYDIRAKISSPLCGFEEPPECQALCLIDLKTSKGVYPLTHMPQLSGYELASVEMGFPPTDAQFILNTHPDGTYDFVRSWSTGEDFLAYLVAHNAVRRIERNDPEVKRTVEREIGLMSQMPARFKELRSDLEPGPLGGLLRSMQKRGLVQCDKGLWSACITRS